MPAELAPVTRDTAAIAEICAPAQTLARLRTLLTQREADGCDFSSPVPELPGEKRFIGSIDFDPKQVSVQIAVRGFTEDHKPCVRYELNFEIDPESGKVLRMFASMPGFVFESDLPAVSMQASTRVMHGSKSQLALFREQLCSFLELSERTLTSESAGNVDYRLHDTKGWWLM